MIGIGAAVLCVFAVMLVRIVRRPGVAVALLGFFFAGKQIVQTTIPFFAEYSAVLNIAVFGVLGLIWTYRLLRGRAELMLGIPREYAAHLVFFSLAFISMLWSETPDVWSIFVEKIPNLLVYALLVPSLIASTRGLTEAYQWLTWAGGGMCLLCLFVLPDPESSSRLVLSAETDSATTIFNPLALGTMGGFTAIASALGDHPQRRVISLLRLVTACAGLVVAARSSRGDFFATVVALGVLGLVPSSTSRGLSGRRLIAGVVALVAGAAILYYGLFLTDYWKRYENLAQDEGTLVRQSMITDMLSYYVDHPSTWLFGAGWLSSYVIVGFYPHNGPVQALAELGLVGATLWWSSVVSVSVRGLRLARLASQTGSRSLDVLRPAVAMMFCAMISNFKAGDCVDPMLALTLATCAQLIRRFRPESEKSILR